MRLQDDIQRSDQGCNVMEGKSSSQMDEWVEVKPKRRLNFQEKARKGFAPLNSALNNYTGIASMAPTLDSPAMSIPGFEKPRNPNKLDDPRSRVGPDQGQQNLSSSAPVLDKLTPKSVHRDDRTEMGNCSPLHNHMDTDMILSEHVDRWKLKFRSLNIPKQIGLSLVVDWAREAGCSHDHKLIANCLDFMDSEAQVSSANISLNILYYLPTFYYFVAHRISKQAKDSPNQMYSNQQEDQKDYSDVKGSDASVYSSPVQNVDSGVEGNHIHLFLV